MSILCFCQISDWKSHWTDGFLKDLNRFFSFKNRERVKMHSIIKNLRFLFAIHQKVSIFVEKFKKMQPLKMTFRSQLEPSIKSYECFMFLLNFILETTLFSYKIRERVKMHSIIKKTYNFSANLIKKYQFLLNNSKKCNLSQIR